MNLKGKKTMDILLYIIFAIIGGVIGCIFTALVSTEKIADMEFTISNLRRDYDDTLGDVIELNAELDEYEEKNVYLQQTVDTYERINTKLKDEIDMLNELIVHASEQNNSNNPEKERLPDGPTNMFCFMDYKKLKNQTADQYWLQQECTTNDMGIRVYEWCSRTYFCAALGSAYGQDIGDTWRVTLTNGTSFNIILADCKGDDAGNEFGHECENYDGDKCLNVIEFVVDPDAMDEKVKDAGTFSRLDIFGGLYGYDGYIAKMEYTGRVWTRS